MRRLALKTGGRPRSLDDLQILQSLADKSGGALLKGRGAFILSGCQVSGLTIAPGIVYIDDTVIEFQGAAVLSFPAYFKAALIEDTELTYEDGNSRPTQTLSTIEIVYDVPSGVGSIPFTTGGGRTYFDAISDSVVLTRGSQVIGGLKSFSEKIVSAGISLVDEIAAIKMPGWVKTDRIADSAVTTSKIADAAVSASKLADGSVGNTKIATNAITDLKIASLAVTSAKLANLSVSTDKIANGSVTAAKLGSDVNLLFGGNETTYTRSVNWYDYVQSPSRTYGYVSYNFSKASKLRPYIKFSFYMMHDGGASESVDCSLERSTSPSFSSRNEVVWRRFRLDGGSWQYCSLEAVDPITASGTYYYRVTCTNSTSQNYFSNSYEATLFSVPAP